MKVVKTKLVRYIQTNALTIFPFTFVDPVYADDLALLKHEGVHQKQQKPWAIYGLGVGLLAWFFLYELVLPVGWNPWRRKWETEAYIAQGVDLETINNMMKQAPYYLWW